MRVFIVDPDNVIERIKCRCYSDSCDCRSCEDDRRKQAVETYGHKCEQQAAKVYGDGWGDLSASIQAYWMSRVKLEAP